MTMIGGMMSQYGWKISATYGKSQGNEDIKLPAPVSPAPPQMKTDPQKDPTGPIIVGLGMKHKQWNNVAWN